MHPLKQLRKLVNSDQPNSGKIVKAGDELLVSTRTGSMTVLPLPGDATQYRVGDEVILANGVIVGRRNRNPTVYVL